MNPSGPYYGAYQFLASTWNITARHAGRLDLVGVIPSNASPADQDAMAWSLYQWQGAARGAGLLPPSRGKVSAVRALRLTAWQHDAELVEVADPEPGPGEVARADRRRGRLPLGPAPHARVPARPPAVRPAVHARPRERGLGRVGRRRASTGLELGAAGRGLRRVGLRPVRPLPAGHGELLREPGRVPPRRLRARVRRRHGAAPARPERAPPRPAHGPRPGRRRAAHRRRPHAVPRDQALARRCWSPARPRS